MARKRWASSPETQGELMLEDGVVQALFALRERGWGVKTIAREMGLAPNTVRARLRNGKDGPPPEMGRPQALKAWVPWIEARFKEGVRNGDVLRQELAEAGVLVSLRTVERITKDLRQSSLCQERATLRYETEPGQQLQVDFGECWLEIGEQRVKVFVFVGTLGYSRRTYARIFPSLCQKSWLDGLEGCLRHFEGAPRECLVDNARALVSAWKADQPVFHPEFQAFCDHYGIRPRACRPYRARTKGKVESGVKYVKKNALGRRRFGSWEALEGHLVKWMREVADLRNHGTTHEKPLERFAREQLVPLRGVRSYRAIRRFSRRVGLDVLVHVDTNRYSVPWNLAGQMVDLELEGEEVRIRWRENLVATHRLHPGRFQVVMDPNHLEGLIRQTYPARDPEGVIRPLESYEKAVGGERW